MPVEIRELVIKATIAVDWENHTIEENGETTVCRNLPGKDDIKKYIKAYFKQLGVKTLEFDQSTLCDFLLTWETSLLQKKI